MMVTPSIAMLGVSFLYIHVIRFKKKIKIK